MMVPAGRARALALASFLHHAAALVCDPPRVWSPVQCSSNASQVLVVGGRDSAGQLDTADSWMLAGSTWGCSPPASLEVDTDRVEHSEWTCRLPHQHAARLNATWYHGTMGGAAAVLCAVCADVAPSNATNQPEQKPQPESEPKPEPECGAVDLWSCAGVEFGCRLASPGSTGALFHNKSECQLMCQPVGPAPASLFGPAPPPPPVTENNSYATHVILLGGHSFDSKSTSELHHDDVRLYSLYAGNWSFTAVQPMSTTRSGAASVAIGTRVWAVGGRSDSSSHLASCERFDIRTMQWDECAAMATPRSEFAAVVTMGAIIAIGGRNELSYLSSLEVYNVTRDGWSSTTLPALPFPRYGHAAAQIDGKLFVVGGHTYGRRWIRDVDTLDLHAPGTSWVSVSNLATGRAGLSAVVLGSDFLLAVGGKSNVTSWLAPTELYDSSCACWQTLADQMHEEGREGAVSIVL